MIRCFQNWTRNDAQILGTVSLFLDYKVPVDAIRSRLTELLEKDERWDLRVAKVEVNSANEHCMEVRILLSSDDSASNGDLCATIREQMIVFLNEHYPDSFARTRIETQTETQA